VLQRKLDATQCDELVTVVGRTNLTTFMTIDVPWRKSRKSVNFRVLDLIAAFRWPPMDGSILTIGMGGDYEGPGGSPP